jgi:hypothetical protein
MTKSITDLAREAGMEGMLADIVCSRAEFERFAALHRASILQELTGEMPKPVGAVYTLNGVSHCTMTKALDDTELYTANQLRKYAAGLVAKAVAAEREECAALCEQFTHYGEASGITCVKAIRNRRNV